MTKEIMQRPGVGGQPLLLPALLLLVACGAGVEPIEPAHGAELATRKDGSSVCSGYTTEPPATFPSVSVLATCNDSGINSIGAGSGAGVIAIGGETGDGVYAVSGARGGYAVEARSANMTNAALRLWPQSRPSTSLLGDIYADRDDRRLYFFNGARWVAISPAP